MTNRYTKEKFKAVGLGVGVSLFIIFLLLHRFIFQWVFQDEVIITVDGRERTPSTFLVFTREGEVFQVKDTLAFGKWDSATRYGKLKINGRYKVRVSGLRVPVLSWYRNIIESTPIEEPKNV